MIKNEFELMNDAIIIKNKVVKSKNNYMFRKDVPFGMKYYELNLAEIDEVKVLLERGEL